MFINFQKAIVNLNHDQNPKQSTLSNLVRKA